MIIELSAKGTISINGYYFTGKTFEILSHECIIIDNSAIDTSLEASSFLLGMDVLVPEDAKISNIQQDDGVENIFFVDTPNQTT
ncbi:hypothetical protein [Vibrio casei]|uniref:hypothetical protein n=1 Tax=Vibrio casei TaxID=673372 RepID=UPI000B5C475D|nr:hypothetical protein [Vibrio casei]